MSIMLDIFVNGTISFKMSVTAEIGTFSTKVRNRDLPVIIFDDLLMFTPDR
jgi:hypothetical protein